MAWVCACCFGSNTNDIAKCSPCGACTDCDGKKVLLMFNRQLEGPPVDTESYTDFLQRLEDVLLPAYKEHFENPTRNRYKTRLHVVRAVIFSQTMFNYRTSVMGEKNLSAARIRYAVALRSFGKLKLDNAEAHVVHIDDSGGFQSVVATGKPWIRRSAGCAFSYLNLLGVKEQTATAISELIREAPATPEGQLVRDAFVLDRLHKLADDNHPTADALLKGANTLLKGDFTFAKDEAHKDAREAIVCEAGLLMKMTNWENEVAWRGQAHGALARVEKVIQTYDDVFPFLSSFYFEDPTHTIKS